MAYSLLMAVGDRSVPVRSRKLLVLAALTCFAAAAGDILDRLDDDSSWERVIAAEPALSRPLSGDGLEEELARVVAHGRRDLPRSWWAAARSWRP